MSTTDSSGELRPAYEDKLDGRISTEFYDQKVTEWRDEQSRTLQAITDHNVANQSYLDEGVALLELASRATDLFETQPAGEKRRLLDFVLSNCTWANGVLMPVFRQPFDMIADAAMVCATEQAAGVGSDGLHQSMLPGRNPPRNNSLFADCRK